MSKLVWNYQENYLKPHEELLVPRMMFKSGCQKFKHGFPLAKLLVKLILYLGIAVWRYNFIYFLNS